MKKCNNCNANMSHTGLCDCGQPAFKPGQLVKCIIGEGNSNLITGQIYTVESVDYGGVKLMQFSGSINNSFFPHRFEALQVPDEVPRVQATLAGKKIDPSRPDITLIPYSALEACAWAFQVGVDKHGRDGYRVNGWEASKHCASIFRHTCAYFYKLEWLCPTDGQPHMGAVMAHASMLIEGTRLGTLKDNRFKGGKNG